MRFSQSYTYILLILIWLLCIINHLTILNLYTIFPSKETSSGSKLLYISFFTKQDILKKFGEQTAIDILYKHLSLT